MNQPINRSFMLPVISLEPADPVDPLAVFTCGCHPEIEQIGPGVCPKCGMDLEPKVGAQSTLDSDVALTAMQQRTITAGIATALLLIIAMGPMVGIPVDRVIGPKTNQLIQLLITSLVLGWFGRLILTRGYTSIVSGHLNMFTLVAIGALAAYGFSVLVIVYPGLVPGEFLVGTDVPLYFESAAVIVTLVLFGQTLELKARHRTGAAIRQLMDLAPKTATRIKSDQSEQTVNVSDLLVADSVRLRPGERVPVDGIILDGSSHINESMLTGESVPVPKSTGDSVIGGTINQRGSFVMRVTQTGSATVLHQIVQLVANAQRSRAPIAKVADRVAGYFVPAVLVASAITFVVWWMFGPDPKLSYALVTSIAVLVIACPCALGLATPMSVMVGIGRAARAGVLVRDADSLQRLATIDTVVLDKTGTLTSGYPTVTSFTRTSERPEAELLRIAAAAQRGSEHPVASAIVAAYESEVSQNGTSLTPASDSSVSEFRAIDGCGISAVVDTEKVQIGSAQWIGSLNAEAAIEFQQGGAGGSQIGLQIAGELVGVFTISDALRPDALQTVNQLKQLGMSIHLCSGDAQHAVTATADALGIKDSIAARSPSEKQEYVRQLQGRGRTVAFVGDGINDAPSLPTADVGVAMGSGTDIAIESADVTLVGGNLVGLVRGIRVSRLTMNNIRQNLAFAFLYNILGVPLAAGAFYPLFGWVLSPMFAAAAMSLSSILVVGNALRLSRVDV